MNLKIKLSVYVFFFCMGMAQGQNIDSLVTAIIDKSEIYRKEEGDYDKAIATISTLLDQLGKEDGVEQILIVPLYHKLGLNYYFYGELEQAHLFASRALDIRLQEYGHTHIDVARNFILLGAINKKRQNYQAAKEFNRQAIISMESLIESNQSTDTLRLVRMYDENIRLNTLLKNNSAALQYWGKSYDFYSRNKTKYALQIANSYNQKGIILINQQKHLLAKQSFKNAYDIYLLLSQKEGLARTFANFALTETKLKDYSSSMTNNLAAIGLYGKLIDKNDFPKWHQRLGIIYANLLELVYFTKEYQLADSFFQKGLKHNKIGEGTIYNSTLAELYRNKARISLAQNKFEEALSLNQKSLQSLVPSHKNEDLFQIVDLKQHSVKDKIAFLETINQKAIILNAIYTEKGSSKQNYIRAAFQNYETLDTVITQVRQSYNAEGSQFELIEQSYPIYEKAIQTAITLFEQTSNNSYLEAAYHFAAKNKALVLLGGIQEEQAKNFSSIPPDLLTTEKTLKRSIFQLESELYDLGDASNTQMLKDSLFTLRRDYQKLIDRFEETYSDYYNSKYGFDRKISVNILQRQLSSNACIIEYFVGVEQLFVFLISKNSFDYLAIDKPDDFEQTIFSFRQQIERGTALNENFYKQSFQIYSLLLERPLSHVDHDIINHLIIIPDGVLMQLPFDVLVQDEHDGLPNYLLRDYSISYAYSNRLLFDSSKKADAAQIFGGFGLEYDEPTLAALATYVDNPLAIVPLSRALGKLQYSDDEIQEIAELIGGDQWINEAATRQAFLDHADQFAILHMATHGLLNEEYPMNSSLAFTKLNDTTEFLLRAADLYNMQLNAEMVVLSACNTGAGMLQKGEGVRSLARAFSHAGCPSLVASLWSASDKSTKDILLSFYKNLKEGMTKDQAMRLAKLDYLDNASPTYRSPYYWSHLSVIGDSNELKVLATPDWKKYGYWILGLFLVIGLTIGYSRRIAS